MPFPRFGDLADRTAAVTGAAHGIGRAIADALSDQGARVVAIDRDEDLLGDAPGSHVVADLASGDTAVLADSVIGEHGPVELVVNNVGTETDASYLDISEPDFDRVMDTNLRGPWFFTKRLVEELVRERRPGRILFISSLHDTYAYGKPHYSASKAAVAMLTKELAQELGGSDIRVNAISPGGIATHGEDDISHDSIPLGRVGVADDVARMALALLSDESARYVTGANVPVDGGAAHMSLWGR